MPNKIWKITNSTSTKKHNLVLIDAFTTKVVPTEFFYEQKINLVTAGSSQPCIVPGGYDTFVMPDVHKDTAGTSFSYTLIVAIAETLEPVIFKTFKADLSDLADLEVTDDMVSNISNVTNFIKDYTACPTSDMAIAFTAALNSADPNAMGNFFAGTQSYITVKIDDVHLVQTYYKVLPYGWAGGKDTQYFLYAKDYKNNTDTDEPIATFSIKNDWTKPAPLTPDSSVFKMELTTLDDKVTKTVVFKNGVFLDSITSDIHKISLGASFIMPSTFTLDNSNNAVEPYLLGKLNGYDVFGLNERAPHEQDEDGGFLDLFDVDNFKEGLDLAMYFITIAMGIGFLVGCYYGIKYVKNKFTSDDALETIKKTQEIKDYIRQNNQQVADLINPRIRIPEPVNIRANQEEIRERLIDFKTRQAKANLQRMVDCQRAELQALANKFVNNDTANALDSIDLVQERLDTLSMEDFREALADNMEMLAESHAVLVGGRAHIENRLTEDQRRAFDESREAYELAAELQEENSRELEEAPEGENEVEMGEGEVN